MWFGVSMPTRGSRGMAGPAAAPVIALQPSVLGRRLELVSGSHRRQVCQTPFGATAAMNTNRPLAHCGVLPERSARMTSSRRNSRLT